MSDLVVEEKQKKQKKKKKQECTGHQIQVPISKQTCE